MTFQLYRAKNKEWRWHLVSPNGNIIAESGEGYKNKAAANRGINIVKSDATRRAVIHEIPEVVHTEVKIIETE
jgi:uncharacterized protein